MKTDSHDSIFLVLIFLPFLALFIWLAYSFFSTLLHHSLFSFFKRNPLRYFAWRMEELPADLRIHLERYAYYQSMPAHLKRFFRHRLAIFIRSKRFIAGNKMQLTGDMKVLAGACAIQVSFGMTAFRFTRFPVIIIMPGPFLSRYTGKYHLGETNPSGSIVFSWPDLKKGFEDPHDNLNLGLHEFAHALFLSNRHTHDADPRLMHYYEEWRTAGDQEYFRMRKEKTGYLRKYAATNPMEFFAVAVEHFFEAPGRFRQHLPGLYKTLCLLLGQDPSRWMKT